VIPLEQAIASPRPLILMGTTIRCYRFQQINQHLRQYYQKRQNLDFILTFISKAAMINHRQK
jgi:hypothetical protein